jgi:hypothetical protein
VASTFTPADALTYAKKMIKDMPVEDVQVRLLDDVSKIMWMAAPWRWTLGVLPDVTLVASTQAYSVALPADFLYTSIAYSVDSAGATPRELAVVPLLNTAVGIAGQPTVVAVTGTAGTTGSMNVSPVPGTQATTTKIHSLYKKSSPEITAESMFDEGTLVFDDEWFWVYEMGVLWMAYMYADDDRAGTAQIDASGRWQYTGYRAMFESGLVQMSEREKLPLVNTWQRQDIKETKR